MLVYGNIDNNHGIADSVYRNMSAILVRNLKSLYDLGDVIYFVADLPEPVERKFLKGLATMSTLQRLAPFSEIQRPKGNKGKIKPDHFDRIVAISTTSPISKTQS